MSVLSLDQRLSSLFGDGAPTSSQTRPSSRPTPTAPHAELDGAFYAHSELDDARARLEHVFDASVLILPSPRVTGASDAASNAKRFPVVSMSDALTSTHSVDAHMQMCLAPALTKHGKAPRARVDAIQTGDVSLSYIVLDYDLEDHGGARMTPPLFRRLVGELSAHPMLAGAVWYSTRGGMRAVVRLAESFALDPSARGADWTALYTHIVASLPHAERWDLACKDASRLMRMPYVRRDEEDQRGELFIPRHVGAYTLDAADLAVIVGALTRSTSRRDAVSGDALPRLFERLGWMRGEFKHINGAPAYLAQCPLEHLHSSENESSTILHATEDDGGYVLHCLHNSCRQVFSESGGWRAYIQQRHADEWRECVGRDELDYTYDPNDHWRFVEQAVELLETAFPNRIFRRHDNVATVERDIHGGARWKVWSVADLTGLLNRVGRWSAVTREGETRRTSVPERMVKIHLVAIADELPLCETCTTLPPLDPETLEPTRFSEGYCEVTQSYFLPCPQLDLDQLRRVYDRPASPATAMNAYMRLIDIYHDFPWRDRAHQVLGASIAFTVALRRSMDVAPMMFVSANNKGVGKTKLISAATASVYGTTPPLASLPSREEELKKVLDSLVHSDSDIFIADNVASRIGGATLDAFLTSPLHTYRPLGITDTRVAPNRVFIGATGNNATLSGDTDRRAIMIRLVTDLEHPEQRRGFRHADLLATARSRVTDTWCAILEILRAWRSAPEAERRAILDEARPFGSYERWAEIVRDPLMWISGLAHGKAQDVVALSREEVDVAREDDRTELFSILADWQASRRTSERWTSRDLFRAISSAMEDEPDSPLAGIGEGMYRCSLRSVSLLIGQRRDQVSAGYRLDAQKRRGTLGYKLTAVDGSEPPPPPPKPDPWETPPTPPTTPTPPPPKPRGEELPVINWTSACNQGSTYEVDARLIEERPHYEPLTRRCSFLREDMCARDRIPCEYMHAIDGGADGGITQQLTDALRSTMSDDIERIEAPPLIPLDSTDHPRAIEIIRAEFEVRATQQAIADRLNRENVPPPNGRKWTSAKVGTIARKNQITRPKKVAAPKADRVLERDGHWSGYWSDAHPLTTPSSDAPSVPQAHSGTRTASAKAILSALYGRAMDCRDAYLARVQFDEAEA